MERFGDAEDPRRRVLINALAAGLLTTLLPARGAMANSIFGTPPSKLPPGQSIYRISGNTTVNGKEATLGTRIGPNDTVQTGKNSEIVFVVGANAMILRGESEVELQGDRNNVASTVISGLRMLSGKLLSVSRSQGMSVKTKTATLGIRGTGIYVEADPELTYFCTCYGITDVVANDDPESKDTVVATHHDKPLYITSGGQAGKNIRLAGFKDHTDQELMLVETIVGRTTPFVFPGNSYSAPRRTY
ncbi:MAG: hypothetical protein A3I66_22270 [Burkholderiales bacterium RIFCSPLOWO2_02_FULL_57_36]|nr:MAG: hypothetical protein A3I66_22270 [Burkholderiales bacterium RIFCSPLOWO2_02_FULL_57_36]